MPFLLCMIVAIDVLHVSSLVFDVGNNGAVEGVRCPSCRECPLTMRLTHVRNLQVLPFALVVARGGLCCERRFWI